MDFINFSTITLSLFQDPRLDLLSCLLSSFQFIGVAQSFLDLITLIIIRSTEQLFCRYTSIWVSLVLSHYWKSLYIWGQIYYTNTYVYTYNVFFPGKHIKQFIMPVDLTLVIWIIYIHHFIKVLPARILYCKVATFFLCLIPILDEIIWNYANFPQTSAH